MDARNTRGFEDRLLLDRLRAGDESAYEELVRAHSPRLLAVARRLLWNEDDAQDALQDGFLAAFKALPGFQAGSRLATWLHRIVVNACLTKLRTARRRPMASLEGASLDAFQPKFLADGHRVLPERDWREDAGGAVETAETRGTVRRAIDELPESYRTVLILRDIEELPTGEVAELLEITDNLVKVRLHRARLALRERLAAEFSGEIE